MGHNIATKEFDHMQNLLNLNMQKHGKISAQI
jgi:hypothetical protein